MKNRRRLTGYLSLIAVVFSLWVFSGCSKSSEPAPTMTIIDLMASAKFKESASVTDDKALDSLVKYVNLYPDLVSTLGTAGGLMTYFAPSNKAFKNLLATPGFPSNIKLINPALIQGVLYYHLVADQKLTSSLTSGTTLTSFYIDPTSLVAQTIVVNSDGTLKTGSTNQSIHFTVPDQKATNGVMHVVESVMIPPTVGASLTPILGTIAGTVLLGADFTDLAQIIAKADANFTESAPNLAFKITTWLAMPVSGTTATANVNGLTFFAIPNAVFKAGATAAGKSEADFVALFTTSSDAARGLLLNHLVVTGKYVRVAASGSTTFANSQPITTKGKAVTVTTGLTPGATYGPYGIVFTNANTPTASSSAYLASSDIVNSNGVIQVIAGVLK